MHQISRIAALAALALVAMPCLAQAQENATELTAGVLGFGYTTCSDCDGVFEIATGGAGTGPFTGLGGGTFAAGFYLSPAVAFEPTVALSRLSSDGESLTVLNLGLAMPYYLKGGWGRQGAYLAPKLAYNAFSAGDESESQVALGLGIGAKTPLNDMAAFRFQVNFEYGFESDLPSTTSFGVFFGLSVFLD